MSNTNQKPSETHPAAESELEKATKLFEDTFYLVQQNYGGKNLAQIAWNIRKMTRRISIRINDHWRLLPGDVCANGPQSILQLGRLTFGGMQTAHFLCLNLEEKFWSKGYTKDGETFKGLIPTLCVYNSCAPVGAQALWILWEYVPNVEPTFFSRFYLSLESRERYKKAEVGRIQEILESINHQSQITKTNSENTAKAKTLAETPYIPHKERPFRKLDILELDTIAQNEQFFRRHIGKELHDFINDIPTKCPEEEDMVTRITDAVVYMSLAKEVGSVEGVRGLLEGVGVVGGCGCRGEKMGKGKGGALQDEKLGSTKEK